MNIETLYNNLEIKYYKNIINYCKKSNIEHTKFENKLKQLKNSEISISESETIESVNENKNNTSESKEIDILMIIYIKENGLNYQMFIK